MGIKIKKFKLLSREQQEEVKKYKYPIRWLMGRVHIATSDFRVAKDILGRLKSMSDRDVKKAIVRWALHCHHENQDVYDTVMR